MQVQVIKVSIYLFGGISVEPFNHRADGCSTPPEAMDSETDKWVVEDSIQPPEQNSVALDGQGKYPNTYLRHLQLTLNFQCRG